MLDNDKQIAAFKALAAEGLHAPASLTTAQSTDVEATSKSEKLASLVMANISYPPTVSDSLTKISNAVSILKSAANAANQFAMAIGGYQSPSQLTQMRIGWECYLKGNEQPETTPFYLITAIADIEFTAAQGQLVSALQTVNTEAAMADINATLSVGAGGIAPALTEEQISKLATATDELIKATSDISKASFSVNELASQANDSAHQANKAFSDAVSVSIISGLLESSVMSDALTAITPISVINALA